MSYRAQYVAVLALLVVFFPSVAIATAYALRPVHKSLVVYAVDRHHHVLPPESRLTPGEHITIVAKGFRAYTQVQVVDVSRRKIHAVRADDMGVARTPFVVPGRGAGHLSVALDGPIAGRAGTSSKLANDADSSARRDRQTVSVTVPLLRRYPYLISGGSGVDAGGVGPGTPTTGGNGGLANTGVAVLALIAAGSLLIVLGAVVWSGSRRREPTATR